ncbi:hypothetical protein FQR65_LT19375 [Abscondita terminalis]|nr:hypothetical protein FQR65_LT19375 [Abscondita terminalis]
MLYHLSVIFDNELNGIAYDKVGKRLFLTGAATVQAQGFLDKLDRTLDKVTKTSNSAEKAANAAGKAKKSGNSLLQKSNTETTGTSTRLLLIIVGTDIGYLTKALMLAIEDLADIVTDAKLKDQNKQYLNHDTFTDIVTFDSSEDEDTIAGDIFISIERIQDNAEKFKVAERDELHRVVIHGVLHLCGYHDKKAEDKKRMTEKER